MKRYLIYFAYNGRDFSGMQIQKLAGVRTVAGAIKHASKYLGASSVELKTSSRTDKGVHALCSTAVLDIEEEVGISITANKITAELNHQFFRHKEDIRILYTRRVPQSFPERHAAYRSYLYRFCLVKSPKLRWALPFPPHENYTTWLLREPVDIEKIQEAAELMSGRHNFSNFTNPSYRSKMADLGKDPVKTMQIKVERETMSLEKYMPHFTENFTSWHATFTSESFLYRQVRLMMWTLAEIGRGTTSMEDLRLMLSDPDLYRQQCADQLLRRGMAPAYALFLSHVHYHQHAMVLTEEEMEGEEMEEPPAWLNEYSRLHGIDPDKFTWSPQDSNGHSTDPS